MNINEFFIRFSLIKGSIQSKLRCLSSLPSQFTHTHLIGTFAQLKLTSQQCYDFFHANPVYVDLTLEWLEKPYNTLIHYLHPNYPPLLKSITGAPIVLFVQGDPHVLATPQIAMVGSRRCGSYGRYFANYFSKRLANALTITSGLALGIDGICHRAALEARGRTVAVLGSGHIHATPKVHVRLAEQIVQENGAVISEFIPPLLPQPYYFPRRNRIISGLSLGIFVIEASLKSGSLITAKYALEQGRDIFVLPNENQTSNYQGNIQLIEDGAVVVTHPEEILSVLMATTLKKFTYSLPNP